MPHLFEPLTLRGVTLRNRIGMAPMCTYSYTNGISNDWQAVHLGARAVGGAGLIIAEASAVEARGRITPADAGIWSFAHIEPLTRVTRFIKEHGAVPGIQIAHAGRKASTSRPWDGGKPLAPDSPPGWPVVGPSPIPYNEGYQVPHELTKDEIGEVQASFKAAAERALVAGFEWLEIHGAHGYLIQSFCSPLSNQRTDSVWGQPAKSCALSFGNGAGGARNLAGTPAAGSAHLGFRLGRRRLDGGRFNRSGRFIKRTQGSIW